MVTYSDHLELVNTVMSLSFNLKSFPQHHLHDAGYKISKIDPEFDIHGKLKPDILFMSATRGLLSECKTGEVHIGGNIGRYSEITVRHLIEKGIDIPNADLELDLSIFGYDNINPLHARLESAGIYYPQILVDQVIQKVYGNDFKDPLLQQFFNQRVEIKGRPLKILKFWEHSNNKEIAPYAFKTLMGRHISRKIPFTIYEFTEELMNDDAATNVWDYLDIEFKRILAVKMEKFLNYCKTHELKRYLKNTDDRWVVDIGYNAKSERKFREDCEDLIQKLDENQRTLTEF